METINDLDKIISFDYEGWPIKKMSIREILEAFGLEKISNRGVDYWQISDKDPRLDIYPTLFQDDGMGYGVMPEYIVDLSINDKDCNMIREKKIDHIDIWLKHNLYCWQYLKIDEVTYIVKDIVSINDNFYFVLEEEGDNSNRKYISEADIDQYNLL